MLLKNIVFVKMCVRTVHVTITQRYFIVDIELSDMHNIVSVQITVGLLWLKCQKIVSYFRAEMCRLMYINDNYNQWHKTDAQLWCINTFTVNNTFFYPLHFVKFVGGTRINDAVTYYALWIIYDARVVVNHRKQFVQLNVLLTEHPQNLYLLTSVSCSKQIQSRYRMSS